MNIGTSQNQERYGGPWTLEKLRILEKYLDAYTTALKGQRFDLMYIDAFAGTGSVELRREDYRGFVQEFIPGSAKIAVGIENRPFDKLVFVERDTGRCEKLREVEKENPGRNIRIENREANEFLVGMTENWSNWRGVLFLDPFATQVRWSTVEKIAGFNALDTWILFPTSAVSRMLPTSKKPEDVSGGLADSLNKIYGGDNWRELYSVGKDLFGDCWHGRARGVDGLVEIYKKKLAKLFGDRFLRESRTLRNSNNSALFEFIFCVGNKAGVRPAKRIAKHILERM